MVAVRDLGNKAGRAARQGMLGLALLAGVALPPLGGGGDAGLCLSSPISLVCPTCAVPLRCYSVDDWLDYFFVDWGALL